MIMLFLHRIFPVANIDCLHLLGENTVKSCDNLQFLNAFDMFNRQDDHIHVYTCITLYNIV